VLVQERQLELMKAQLVTLSDLINDNEPPKPRGWKEKLCNLMECYPACEVR